MKTLMERAKILVGLANGVTELAKVAGVKPPSVSDWLNGKTQNLKAKPAANMARHFKLNIKWVIDGIGPMEIPQMADGLAPRYGEYSIDELRASVSDQGIKIAANFDALSPENQYELSHLIDKLSMERDASFPEILLDTVKFFTKK